jgi:hypothetical protein
MWQQWINLAGLTLDFLGVILLANEWRIAIGAEAREAEIAEREEMFKPSPMMPKPQNPQQPVFDWMRERERFRQMSSRTHMARRARQGWFKLAMIMITAGFFLQMLGSWPGGLPR